MSEEFGSTIDERPAGSKYRKTEFMNLEAGEHRFRILESMETKKYTHYIGFAYIECLGDDCPVCENNKKILYEHPEDYRDQKGWAPRNQRFYINVFDKSSVSEDGKYAQGLPPINKVKVLSMGSRLLEEIKVLSKSVRDKEDNRIDIRMYDFILEIKGEKQNKTTHVAHKWWPGEEALQDTGGQELFDLSEVAVKLSREEMLDVFNGAKLKDIFTMRRAQKQIAQSDFLSAESTQETEDDINNLFKA
jgi:hypothetical protein